MSPQHSLPPRGLALTPSQDVSPSAISELVCADAMTAVKNSASQKGPGTTSWRALAAAWHKALACNTGFNLSMSLRQVVRAGAQPRAGGHGQRRRWGSSQGGPPFQTPPPCPALPVSASAVLGALCLGLLDNKCLIKNATLWLPLQQRASWSRREGSRCRGLAPGQESPVLLACPSAPARSPTLSWR